MNKYLSNLINSPYLRLLCIPLFTYAFLLGVKAYAQEGPTAEHAVFVANNVWMLVATFLVFIMHLGFATLEAGLTRSKNTINILFKNTFIVAMGIITYAIVGFNLMYPGDFLIGQFFWFCRALDLCPGRCCRFNCIRRWGLYVLDRLYLPGNVCCNCSNYSFRCCSGKGKAKQFLNICNTLCSFHLSDCRILEMGRRLAGPDGFL